MYSKLTEPAGPAVELPLPSSLSSPPAVSPREDPLELPPAAGPVKSSEVKEAVKQAVAEKPPAAAAGRAPPPAPALHKYVVKKGDVGLMQIAREELGDVHRWRDIARLNGLQSPYVIRVGQELDLPN